MKSFSVLLSLACIATASPLFEEQVPLGAGLMTSYPGFTLDLNAQRLVKIENQAPVWVSELEKIRMKAHGVKFFDITDTRALGTSTHLKLLNKASFPSPNATEKVRPILKTLSTKGPRENLEKFSSFRTRHYRSDVKIALL